MVEVRSNYHGLFYEQGNLDHLSGADMQKTVAEGRIGAPVTSFSMHDHISHPRT